MAIPWLNRAANDAAHAIGPAWRDGVDANRATLDTMMRYAVADGLATEALSAEQLFA